MKTSNLLTTITLIAAGLCLATQAHAVTSPAIDTLNVSGYMRNAGGANVTNGTYSIVFGVRQNNVTVWAQQQSVTITKGLFSVSLTGNGTAVTAPTVPIGTGLDGNFAAVPLTPALLSAAARGEIVIRVYSVTPIDGNNPQLDIATGTVPTAMIAALAQGVEAGGINLAALSAVTTAVSAPNLIPLLDGGGLLLPSMIPNLPASTITSGSIGVGNGGTGSANGSITGTGAVVYEGAPGTSTTIGDNSGGAATILRAGTGGISETVTGATGDLTYAAGTGSGNVSFTPGQTGSVSIGTTSGTGNINLNPGAGLVRITNGNGLMLVNGGGSVTVNSSVSSLSSWTMTLPQTVGAAGNFLQTTDTAGTTTWAGLTAPGPIGGTTPSTGAFTSVTTPSLASATGLSVTRTVATSGTPNVLSVTGPADTTLTASTEATDVLVNLARTVQFATGNFATQRAVRFQAPTYSFVAASTIGSASTVSISGPPVAGANATFTNKAALVVESGNVGIGTSAPTAELQLAAGTATAGTAPLKLTTGVNLTTAEAGAVEYDGASYYATPDTTGGRGVIPVQQLFRLNATAATVGPAIANYFGANSNISLVPSALYEIDIYCYFAKVTANTITWTLTNSAAPTSQNIFYEMSPILGMVAPPGTATMLVGQVFNDTTAAKTILTGNLTATNHYMHMKVMLQNGLGTSLKIQVTSTTGSVTPGIGSYWIARRLPANTGIFAP